MENTQDTGRRILYFDLMRIAASFFIIVLHVCSTKWKDADVFSHEWAVLNFYEAVSRWTPAVFVMISGALFFGRDIPLKKLYGKYVLRIVLAFAFWSCLYAFIYHFLPGHSTAEFAKAFISGPTHMWFLYMIAALYAVGSSLRARSIISRLSEYCFGIFLVHILVINTLNNRFGINCLPFEPVICVPLLSLLVFILSCAISAVLHRIPFVKKHLV